MIGFPSVGSTFLKTAKSENIPMIDSNITEAKIIRFADKVTFLIKIEAHNAKTAISLNFARYGCKRNLGKMNLKIKEPAINPTEKVLLI